MTDATMAAIAVLKLLPTPVMTDALVRLGLPVRQAPAGIIGPASGLGGGTLVGPALPTRHSGSVDVFLEALEQAEEGDVLVIDNGGRRDEACIGDLIALELQAAGIAGAVIWGLHRDADEVAAVGLPVFSYGTVPSGPLEVRPNPPDRLERAWFGEVEVTREDVVAADSNGVLFLPGSELERIAEAAAEVRDQEAEQARLMRAGTSLREQLGFADFLRARATDPTRTFRQHLRERRGAIEE